MNDSSQNTPKLHSWEDTSESFCLIRLAQITGKKLLVFMDRMSTPEETSFIHRYLGSFSGLEAEYAFGSFNIRGRIASLDDRTSVLAMIQREKPIILSFYSETKRGRDIETDALISQLPLAALKLPNFRYRCESLFLRYYEKTNLTDKLIRDLYDNESRSAMREVLRAAFENDIYRLPEGDSEGKYFECYRHLDEEVWLNCGSCRGDTIMTFLSRGFRFKRIFALEGDCAYLPELKGILALLPENLSKKIRLMDFYLDKNTDPEFIKKLFAHIGLTLINMDIEGFELTALRALRPVISRDRPVLAISAYHKAEDLETIPAFVNDAAEGYNFFFRKYCGAEANAFNEYLYYCVPNERLL